MVVLKNGFIKRLTVFAFVFCYAVNAGAQLTIPGLEGLRKLMSDCRLNYRMKCTYPGGKVYDIAGAIAVKQDNFYDSSNLRFVMFNNDWYFIADHTDRSISLERVKKLNEDLDGLLQFSPSSFLFDEGTLAGVDNIETIRQTADTSWFNIRFKDTSMVQRLEMTVLRKDLQLLMYKVKMKYSIGGYEDGPGGDVQLDIYCYDIKNPVDEQLFSTDRLFRYRNKKLTLNRFKTYKLVN